MADLLTTLDFNGDGLKDFAVEYNGGQIRQDTPLVWLNDGNGHFNSLKARDFVDAGQEFQLGSGQLVNTAAGYSFVSFNRGKDGMDVKALVATVPYEGGRASQSAPPSTNSKEAAVAATGFFTGKTPDGAAFANRADFAQDQYVYYRDVLKVASPELGPYEALGLAFSNALDFQARYGLAVLSQSAFVAKAYADVFGRPATTAQLGAFEAQIDYFSRLYVGAGVDKDLAALNARGAVAGQMTGYVMTSATERTAAGQTLDDKAAVFLAGIPAGTEPFGLTW